MFRHGSLTLVYRKRLLFWQQKIHFHEVFWSITYLCYRKSIAHKVAPVRNGLSQRGTSLLCCLSNNWWRHQRRALKGNRQFMKSSWRLQYQADTALLQLLILSAAVTIMPLFIKLCQFIIIVHDMLS